MEILWDEWEETLTTDIIIKRLSWSRWSEIPPEHWADKQLLESQPEVVAANEDLTEF